MDSTQRNPNLKFAAPELAGGSVGPGKGLKYHSFSSKVVADKDTAETYQVNTGLNEDTGVTQSWGTDQKHRVFRSRRGSIGGVLQRTDGSVAMWRMSSHATSEALAQPNGDSAEAEYRRKAIELATPAVNTRGTEQSVNAVLSDFGKVQYNPTHSSGFDAFKLEETTNATAVSGTGLHRSVGKDERANLFAPSIESMEARGKSANPAQAYHSEPMAITFHDAVRKVNGNSSLRESREMVGIMESFPNQICAQCGPMMSQRVGTDGIVGGNPGVPFGGQKPGGVFPSDVVDDKGAQLGQSTVFRAIPSKELDSMKQNLLEVRAIYDHHTP